MAFLTAIPHSLEQFYPYNGILFRFPAFYLSSLSVGQIRPVIALLHPRHQRQNLLNRIRPQGQDHVQDGP